MSQTPKDTRWRLLYQIVAAAFASAASPDPSNAPKPHDTRWQLIRKWNRIQAGV